MNAPHTPAASVLRPYQLDAIDALHREFVAGRKRVVLQMATGSGKTAVAAEMIKRSVAKGRRCLFIADRIELIDQTSRRFDLDGIPHGVIQADHERVQPWQQVQIASIQTLARRRFPDARLVIVDECHSQYAAMNNIMEKWNNVPMVGLSATPWAKGMGKHWQSLVVGATTSELIAGGYLVPFTVFGPPGPDLRGVHTVGGDYNQSELGDAVNRPKLVGDIVETWQKRGEDRQTIVFAVNIAHSKAIVAEFVAHGVRAEHVDAYSDSDERRAVLARFKSGDTKIVSCVDILSKGFDEPSASCLIAARPTKSLMLHVQQVGRVLRPAPLKADAIVLDHAGNTARLGFVTDDLPTVLDDGERKKGEAPEKKESLPTPCPKCFFMKDAGVHECPECGFAPERKNKVTAVPGDLVRFAAADTEMKLRWFAMLRQVAIDRCWNPNAVNAKFMAKFGTWPTFPSDIPPIQPDETVRKWLIADSIRFAKARAKANQNPPAHGPRA